MDSQSILEPVSAIAVWGSLGASFVLCAVMSVQAVLDRERRSRYALFATVMGLVVLLDLSFSVLQPQVYELLRVFLWPAYGLAVMLLFDYPSYYRSLVMPMGIAGGIAAVGVCCWLFIDPDLATTCVLPLTFAVAAVTHFRQFQRTKGFGSLVLFATSAAHSFQCLLFYSVVSLGDPLYFSFGYLHYAVTACVAVLGGWIQIPRELRGKMPVVVSPYQAKLFALTFLSAELIILPTVFLGSPLVYVGYIGGSFAQLAAYLLLFFQMKHELVIFTDNVSQLLFERTRSLHEAQERLTQQNLEQARVLEIQASDLSKKSDTIERQRRLELAAQCAGQASHDIQNLLTPIHRYCEAVREQFLSGARDTGSHTVDLLQRAVQDLSELNTHILSLSRRGRVEEQPVSINGLLEELQARYDSVPVAIEKYGEYWVKGSWSQMIRAVGNVLQNAHEASPSTEVHLSLQTYVCQKHEYCDSGIRKPGEYVEISIADQGTGIPQEVQEKIWEPFFSTKSTERRSGSGLGMSVVAAVLDDHGGAAEIETSTAGTTFRLFFPLLEHRSERTELTGTESLLIVDDDPEVHDRYEAYFAEKGYLVNHAYDGREALRLLQIEEFDAALVDINMPKMSGLELLIALSHMRSEMVVMIQSEVLSEQVESQAYMYGASAVFQKPLDLDTVTQELRRHFALGHSSPEESLAKRRA